MPHVGHVSVVVILEAMGGVLTDVAIGDLPIIRSRLVTGRRGGMYWRMVGSVVTGVGADVHTVCDIGPDLRANI